MTDFEATIQLVQAAQGGDRGALERLFERYFPRVRRIVWMRLDRPSGQLEDYDDLIQESLLDVLRSLDGFEDRSAGRFCNWVARCVENNIRDHLRRGSTAKRGSGRVRPFADCGGTTLAGAAFDGTEPTPSEVGQARELDARIERAMGQLNDRYREVIILRVVCEMSARESAAEMALDNAEVAQKLFERARARLAELV